MTVETSPNSRNIGVTVAIVEDVESAGHASLKYSLLGPSLTKAGQDSVDQSVV